MIRIPAVWLCLLFTFPAAADEATGRGASQRTDASNASWRTCRSIGDRDVRLACYDRAVDAIYPPEDPPTTEPDTATTPPPPRIAQSEPAREQRRADPSGDSVGLFGRPSERLSQRKQIVARIKRITRTAHRKLTIELDNDQRWQQLDSKTIRLAEGDAVTIRAASLDSYQLGKSDGGKSIRVKRID